MNNDSQTLEKRVGAHPFLRGLDAHQLHILTQAATATDFQADETIFRAGGPADGFFLIEGGKVTLEATQGDGQVVSIDVVGAGEPLGWSWIFEPYVWQFDARATEPTSALCFSAELLRQHRGEDLMLSHELFKRMCEVMVRRLQNARQRLASREASGARDA